MVLNSQLDQCTRRKTAHPRGDRFKTNNPTTHFYTKRLSFRFIGPNFGEEAGLLKLGSGSIIPNPFGNRSTLDCSSSESLCLIRDLRLGVENRVTLRFSLSSVGFTPSCTGTAGRTMVMRRVERVNISFFFIFGQYSRN